MPLQMQLEPILADILASVALLLALVVAQLFVARSLKRGDELSDQAARRWAANFRNALVLIAAVGLVMIWAPQLRTFALSLTAVAVAIVIATKELILCLSGSMLRTFTRAYAVGDLIEIGSVRGEVLDYNLLGTRLKEFDPDEHSSVPTGREIAFPNSLLFLNTVRVQPKASAFKHHRVTMVFDADVDIFAMHERFKSTTEKILQQHGGGSPESTKRDSVEVRFSTTELGKYQVEINVDGGSANLQTIESDIVSEIGSLVHAEKPSLTPS
ncbi:hypothetical protein MTsPCn7_27620 [Altererythrobacter sp. MTPC7]